MVKNTAVNTTTTPSGQREFADGILGRIQEPQTRWSAGALVSAIIAAATVPIVCAVTGSKVVAIATAAEDTIQTLFGSDSSFESMIQFTPSEDGTARSRVMTAAPYVPAIKLLDENEADVTDTLPVEAGVLLPVLPTYTALTLVNKLESIAVDKEWPYLIAIDQNNGKASFFSYSTEAEAATALGKIIAAGSVLAAFDMSTSAVEPETPQAFSWE